MARYPIRDNLFPSLIMVGQLAQNLGNDQTVWCVRVETARHLGSICIRDDIAKAVVK
jgi:hypothetical protein